MRDDELMMRDSVSLSKMATFEAVLDRLADALLETHDILCILDEQDSETLQWIRDDVRAIYQALHQLMKRLSN